MPYVPTEILDAKRLQDAACADAQIAYKGYRATYSSPTAKDRLRVIVTADPEFDNFKMMVDELDRIMMKYDDPIIYVGGYIKEENAYQNNLILGWARYNWYESFSFAAVGNYHKRNVKFCNICTHLAAFHNGKNYFVKELIDLARTEEIKIRTFRY